MKTRLLIVIAALSASASALADSVTFASPNGLTEECRNLPQIPDGKYDMEDFEEEQLLCGIDFYDTSSIALCPKTWSTSPGTMIYDIRDSGLTQFDYESQKSCGGKKDGHEKITKFKQTMNQSGTSGTFSQASLLYYHFSRYFDTSVKVPVMVYRTMDRVAHFERVTKKAHENRMGKGDMIQAGWEWLYDSEQNPDKYKPKEELFVDGDNQIFGVLGDGGGERYGEEINGIRSAWGDRQNHDFQETPAFLALRSEKPLLEAIAYGLEEGQKNSKVKRAMGGGASNFQMAVWMRELTDIVILDYIFSQQDRVGNIDFKWYVYYIDGEGKVKSKKLDDDTARSSMSKISYPKEIDGFPTQLVQRSRINDNDAGGKPKYSNFTKRTEMLQKIRHMDRKTFDKVVALNADFQAQGPIYQYVVANMMLSPDQVARIVENTSEVAAILTGNESKIQFDLDGVKDLFKALQ